MALEPVDVDKLGAGPCKLVHGGSYLGRTLGDTTGEYSIDTNPLDTEEDGDIDEIVNRDAYIVTAPLAYTDALSLGNYIPWGEIVTDGENAKLIVKSAIGKRLSQYADKLTIHPLENEDTDLSDDVTVFRCYPKPGPINFTYSRTGRRIANVQFVAMRDEENRLWGVGDQSIDTTPLISTEQTITAGDIDPIIIVNLQNDSFVDEEAEDETNWTYSDTASGLTINTVKQLSDTAVAISFDGTAAAETATLTVGADALSSGVASNAMSIPIAPAL